MTDPDIAARAALALLWALFAIFFFLNYVRLREYRRREGEIWENRLTDRPSRRGLYLQATLLFAFLPSDNPRPLWILLAGIIFAAASTLLVRSALAHIGNQWRVNTVVTADHKLVTSGPYSVLRHPIYTALLGMTIGTGLIFSSWPFLLIAVTGYCAGTEIRVRAEDALLARHFEDVHDAWRARTWAWIPLLR